jgi:formylglycine-generating enzyme
VKIGWALTALGVGAGTIGAFLYARNTWTGSAESNQRPVQLTEDAMRVAAWVDAKLLAAAAARAKAPPDEVDVSDAGVELPQLREQREHLYHVLAERLDVDPKTVDVIAGILEQSPYAGTGNPVCTAHPMLPEQCLARRAKEKVPPDDSALCDAPNMVAVFDPKTQDVNRARLCIDQFEFPNLPCEYPLVWVRASEAAQICRALGKRLCDAHEWEGACAGALLPADQEYDFSLTRDEATKLHNDHRIHSWLGSLTPQLDQCGTMSAKSPNCWDVTWEACGSNTYPAGAFPSCVSPFGIYDMLGNVAEHMNLALRPEQLASRGGLGETEMKGSWFAYDGLAPYPDDCRWRAPSWHQTAVDSPSSHRNYQLGFRCCKDIY